MQRYLPWVKWGNTNHVHKFILGIGGLVKKATHDNFSHIALENNYSIFLKAV